MTPEEWSFMYDPNMGSLKYVITQTKSEVLCVAYCYGHEITEDDLKYVDVIDMGESIKFVCKTTGKWSKVEKSEFNYTPFARKKKKKKKKKKKRKSDLG